MNVYIMILKIGVSLMKYRFIKSISYVKCSYTIAHSKRRTQRVGVFECALATVTLSRINPLCYIQHLSIAEMAIYKSAV